MSYILVPLVLLIGNYEKKQSSGEEIANSISHGIQAIERFGWERTGIEDFDSDCIENEMSIGNLTALIIF